MPHSKLDDASRHVTYAAVRQTLVEMVDIRSPTGGEADMAAYVHHRLSTAGLDTSYQYVNDGRPNTIGVLPGTGEGLNLLFTGHMDTSYDGDEDYLVGDGFKPKAVERDGWVWGLGANNMKSGLAAALVAVEAITKAGIRLPGDLSFGGVVGEIEKTAIEEFEGVSFSGYGSGSKHLVTHGGTGDFAILVEPTGLRICTANMGVMWVRISVEGTVSHSVFSKRPGVTNAIELMGELKKELDTWITAYEERHAFMGEHPNITVSAIRGGAPWRLSRNPYDCSMYLDIRTVPGQSMETVKRELRRLVRGFAGRMGCAEPKLHVYITDPPMLIDESLPVVQALGAAQQSVSGERPTSTMRRPGADGIHFCVYGVPCAVFGPGGRMHPDTKGKLMHAAGEHVLIEDVLTSARIYLATALDLCSRPAETTGP